MSFLKLLALATLSLAIVSAQVTVDTAADISLTSTGTTTLSSVAGSTTGTLIAVGCTVRSGPSGSISATFDVTLDGNSNHKKSYTIYSSSNSWPNSLVPFTTTYNFFASGHLAGANPDDVFRLPVNEAYTDGLTVAVHVTSAGSTGTLRCSTIHT